MQISVESKEKVKKRIRKSLIYASQLGTHFLYTATANGLMNRGEVREMKKTYSKPELKVIAPGTPRYREIIALLNSQEKSKQKDSKTNGQ